MSCATSYSRSKNENGTLVVTVLPQQVREAATAYALRDEIVAQIDASRPSHIVLDLAAVRLIGSIGFLAFLGVRRHLGSGRIVLCNLSQPVREMFAVCRLIPTDGASTAPFEVEASLEAALARLNS